ncbi:hypothetical protein Q9Q94_10880 [Uliginosibacterium sp. 31-16]|uniref:hypothetical protein n=1 Tax=Uliginosibacterium sp. 31-16 TaxID=3068315 RepID=UPI00273FB78C|nr:hypothetical protein [Uliginosibacterium sp. 31-16]MDP5240038.1 hypothetical protein [Uliginosibacterium sp. 31-16]
MSTLDITTAYKYINLQMAAEVLYDFNAVENGLTLVPGAVRAYPTIREEPLKLGNLHASKFTATQAAEFSAHWKVVEHKSNTTTGFSGTLLQCYKDDPATGAKAGELVLSMGMVRGALPTANAIKLAVRAERKEQSD